MVKMENKYQIGLKTLWEKEKQAISPFLTMFSTAQYCVVVG